MKLKILLLIVLPLTISNSCKKESPSDEKKVTETILISGITELDSDGNNIGFVDQTDWQFTDIWTNSEEALFERDNPSVPSATESFFLHPGIKFGGYPNPVKASLGQNMISFHVMLSSNMYYDIRIVDSNLNTKVKLDSIRYSLFKVDNSIFRNNELYRIYYQIYHEAIVYRGHGDFKFVE